MFHCKDGLLVYAGTNQLFICLRRRYFWLRMYQDILAVANGCEQCDVAKKRRLNVPSKQLHSPVRKLSHVYIDIYGLKTVPKSDNKTCVLSMIDVLTGYVAFRPLSSSSWLQNEREIVRGGFSYFGFPDAIHCVNKIYTKSGTEWVECLDYVLRNSANYTHHQA